MDISLEYSNVDQLRRLYGLNLVAKAIRAAVGTTTNKTKTFVSREVRQIYNIKAGDIKSVVGVRALDDTARLVFWRDGKADLDKFAPKVRWAKVEVNHPVVGRHRAKRQKVTVRVRKDKGRQDAHGAFFGSGRGSGKKMLFRREDKNDNASRPVVQDGPSIPHMVGQVDKPKIEQFVANEFEPQFVSRMNWEITKIMRNA